MPTLLYKKNKGFSLPEVILVIIIIGVLATLALPRMTSTVEKSRSSEGVQILGALLSAQKIYEYENGSYATTVDDLDVSAPSAQNFNAPTVANNAARVATIGRSDGSYTLCISADGGLTCDDGAGGTVCNKIGITDGSCS